ncbi:MAG: alkaline phosphatase [Siphonobacter aquaeclarae]|nr:alkaline phosphatase [Siphonobacter aquaeclarae]
MKKWLVAGLFLWVAGTVHAQVRHAKHVLLIGVDGLGSYCFPKATIPTFQKMMDNGAWTLKARSVLPSSSAVNWASMLMGAGPEVHGYTEWNSQVPEPPSQETTEYGMFPTVFYLLKKQRPKATSAVVYEWDGIGYLYEKQCVTTSVNCSGDSATAVAAIQCIEKDKPSLLFVHFSEVDNAGHAVGHGTRPYIQAVNRTDWYVGQLLAALERAGIADETLVLLTSDHGGISRGHGGKSLQEMEIPWILYGKAVRQKGEIRRSVMTYDTAATLAYVFGLKTPEVWTGRPLSFLF